MANVELKKEVKGYNTLNSGVIFVPARFVGARAKVLIEIDDQEEGQEA